MTAARRHARTFQRCRLSLLRWSCGLHAGSGKGNRIVLLNRGQWPSHRPWLIFCLLVTAAACGWFSIESAGTVDWPSGSSPVGFSCGVAGGLIILFEFLLWWRKKVRVWRIGRTQVWMRAHIWLGLLCLPLLALHSGFRWGGTLSTALMALLLVVIASGVWGLALQQWLPQQMLVELPAETVYSQIEHLSKLLLAETDRVVRTTCGPAPGEIDTPINPILEGGGSADDYVVVGAVRTVGRLQGKVVHAEPATNVPESEPLRVFFHSTVAPFLRAPDPSSPLHHPTRRQAAFDNMRTRLPPAAHASLKILEESCDQRWQWARQARLHFWLHNWLWIHFPLSVALIVLMFAHIWGALKHW